MAATVQQAAMNFGGAMREAGNALALGDVERPIQIEKALPANARDRAELNARLNAGLRHQRGGVALEGFQAGHGRVERFPKGCRIAVREGFGYAPDKICWRGFSGQKWAGEEHGEGETVAPATAP